MRENRAPKAVLWRCLTFIAAAVFVISAALLARDLLRSRRERWANEKLAQLASAGAPAPAISGSAAPDEIPDRRYAPLLEQNRDMAAWLLVPDTPIDYPVMYTPEEPEYYLRRAFDGSYAVSGCLFLGKDSPPDSNHVIIYGHRMNDGTMFGTLKNYADPEYAAGHAEIQYDLVAEDGSYQRHTYEVMAAFYSRVYKTGETDVFRFYYATDLSTPEAFEEYVSQAEAAALYDTGVHAEYGDRLLTLVTCDYYIKGGRFVVVARESAE